MTKGTAAPITPPVKAAPARVAPVIGCPVTAFTTTVAPTLVAAPARALPMVPLPMSGKFAPIAPATPPPKAPCNMLWPVTGCPVSKLIAVEVPAPVKAPIMVGSVTPRLVTMLVIGLRL